MNFPTIRIEGSILSPDILDKIEQSDITGQLPKDFGFDSKIKVKDEIARAWADANSQWKIFKSRIENTKESDFGNTETRKYWIIPLLGFIDYEVEYSKSSESVNGKSYAISHRAVNIDNFPIHVMGFKDSLDKKRADSGPRMSPHSLIQEYINLTEHLYAIVTNGFLLRLLRDSSRLIKLSYIEFDLEKMFEEEHYTDFALFYRLLHSSRMPKTKDLGPESIIEKYHQDALDSGARIRDGLCNAVENSIMILGNGFLNNHSNSKLRNAIDNLSLTPDDYHKSILRLIYRLLFLMVIEERGLVFQDGADLKKKMIYYDFYSVSCLRKLCEKRFILNEKYNNYWIQLKNTFKLFESEQFGRPLGIKPLAGELFGYEAIGLLNECDLDNSVLMQCFRNLSFYESEITNQVLKVNYAALNVEEFGSVYEGLLEYKPDIEKSNGFYKYSLKKGSERSSSGSHYTPDELVQPLIKHSLDYIIEDKLKDKEPEKALLSITVCDVACGSGHILLNAARRIAVELAKVRTGEDQPSPSSFRHAIKDVIKNCIYGVDRNPLAVELCKIALWLESHNPGEPLSFLDHKIKCGDSIVGLAHKEELLNGIPTEAFKSMPDDDKNVCSEFKKRNKIERTAREKKKQIPFNFRNSVENDITAISSSLNEIIKLPESTPEEVEGKKQKYLELNSGNNWWHLKNLADIQVAQFFIKKISENKDNLVIDKEYFDLFPKKQILGDPLYVAILLAQERKIFHWFIEFPDVFQKGGFDCILGNPPFRGGLFISNDFGNEYTNFLKYNYSKAGSTTDIVAYFFRRCFNILKKFSYMALIGTNSISEGDTRETGLSEIIKNNGTIIMAVRSTKWPGSANLSVSIISIANFKWSKSKYLNEKPVNNINSKILAGSEYINPFRLNQRIPAYLGTTVYGKGFFLVKNEVLNILKHEPSNIKYIKKFLNGDDVLKDPYCSPSRFVLFFQGMPLEGLKNISTLYNIAEERIFPERQKSGSKGRREKWWLYTSPADELYNSIKKLNFVFVTCFTSKYIIFTKMDIDMIFSNAVIVITSDDFAYFSVLQSSIHGLWVQENSSTLETRQRYAVSDCYDTFPFPNINTGIARETLIRLGKAYHEIRKDISLKSLIGLTKVYNDYHSRYNNLENIIAFRNAHMQLDYAVLDSYGWSDISLRHDFYEVDYLPENDRIRFTIHPDARKEILNRLLELNHKIHDEEVKAGLWDKKKTSKSQSKTSTTNRVSDGTGRLFE